MCKSCVNFALKVEKPLLFQDFYRSIELLPWQIIFVLIPDIRKLAGAEVSTMDFVLSQDSGNAALLIWMTANAIWAGAEHPEMDMEMEM